MGYGIISRMEGEDLGQVWEQRRQTERLPQGHEKGEGRSDWRAWPDWRLMQGRALVYT